MQASFFFRPIPADEVSKAEMQAFPQEVVQQKRTQAGCTDRSKRARRQAGAASGQKGFFSDEEKTSRPGREPGGMFLQKGGQSLLA